MSDPHQLPHTLTSAQLLAELKQHGGKMNSHTLWTLSLQDLRWAACVIRRTKRSTTWSTARLIEAGILRAPPEPVLIRMPTLTASFQTTGMA